MKLELHSRHFIDSDYSKNCPVKNALREYYKKWYHTNEVSVSGFGLIIVNKERGNPDIYGSKNYDKKHMLNPDFNRGVYEQLNIEFSQGRTEPYTLEYPTLNIE